MFPIVKDHHLNDNKIYTILSYINTKIPLHFHQKILECNKYDMYIFCSLCRYIFMVEPRRIELLTSCVQSRRSPS